jgi:hypothetical protein
MAAPEATPLAAQPAEEGVALLEVVSGCYLWRCPFALNCRHTSSDTGKGIAIALRVHLVRYLSREEGNTMATEFARKESTQSEGQVAKAIEAQTSKLPSDAFLWMAVGSMAVSATFQMMGNKNVSLFVGQWAPTLLIFGLYNKLVKQLGSDRTENAV